MILEVESQSKALQAGNEKTRHDVHAFVCDLHACEKLAFEPLLSAEEAAVLLGKHVNTVRLWARQGKIPSRHVGRRVTFRKSELNRWYEEPCYAGHAVRAAQPERTAV